MMNRYLKIAVLFISAYVSAACGCLFDYPLLILNSDNFSHKPRNFRTTDDAMDLTDVNTVGLSELHIAGGAQLSEQGLIKLIEKSPNLIWDIDLRLESHGLVSGFPVSWYGEHNWANLNKTNEAVELDQVNRLSELKERNLIFIQSDDTQLAPQAVHSQHKDFWFPFPLILPATGVLDEPALVKKYGVKYVRFYVPDHRHPSDVEVQRFIEFIQQVPKDEWLYFHCAAGRGRTTTFMAMYDMLYNARQVSFDDIIRRQYLLGGKNLAEFEETSSFKYQHAVARLAFLKEFYRYAQANDGEFKTTWINWLTSEGDVVHIS